MASPSARFRRIEQCRERSPVLDRRWKTQKIALGRPDPVQRLLVGGRNTTHFMIIPVLGYSGKRALTLMDRVSVVEVI